MPWHKRSFWIAAAIVAYAAIAGLRATGGEPTSWVVLALALTACLFGWLRTDDTTISKRFFRIERIRRHSVWYHPRGTYSRSTYDHGRSSLRCFAFRTAYDWVCRRRKLRRCSDRDRSSLDTCANPTTRRHRCTRTNCTPSRCRRLHESVLDRRCRPSDCKVSTAGTIRRTRPARTRLRNGRRIARFVECRTLRCHTNRECSSCRTRCC